MREQACDGSFIDNHGISAIITADILNVVIHLVGTSNDGKNPVTVIGSNENRKKTFHIGYYQDTTDTEPRESPTYRSGHYQSLVPDHSQSLPRCCV